MSGWDECVYVNRENIDPLFGSNPFPDQSSWGERLCIDGDHRLHGDTVNGELQEEMVYSKTGKILKKNYFLFFSEFFLLVKQNKK